MANALFIGETAGNLSAVKAPTEYEVTNSDLDAPSTGRVASGRMVRDVVRGGDTNVRSIDMKWARLTNTEMSALLTALKPKYIWVRYLDPQTFTMRTAQFYVSDRKSKLSYFTTFGDRRCWGEMTCTLIEV